MTLVGGEQTAPAAQVAYSAPSVRTAYPVLAAQVAYSAPVARGYPTDPAVQFASSVPAARIAYSAPVARGFPTDPTAQIVAFVPAAWVASSALAVWRVYSASGTRIASSSCTPNKPARLQAKQ